MLSLCFIYILKIFLGNLFNYHAELLNSEATEPSTVIKKETPETFEVKQEAGVKSERFSPATVDSDFSAIADKVFEEAQELLATSPWIADISKILSSHFILPNCSFSGRHKMISYLQIPPRATSFHENPPREILRKLRY